MNRYQTVLYKVGLRVFENLCFMLPTSELDEEQASAAFEAGVTVDFSGPINGTLLLLLSGPILPDLAANMLGQETPPTLSQQHDTLREVANVICGNLMPHIGDFEAVFKVEQPQVRNIEEIVCDSLGNLNLLESIGLERGRADLLLFVSEALPLQEQ